MEASVGGRERVGSTGSVATEVPVGEEVSVLEPSYPVDCRGEQDPMAD